MNEMMIAAAMFPGCDFQKAGVAAALLLLLLLVRRARPKKRVIFNF